ncbi:MAG: hypothetical protein R8G33_03870 [Gammaproteobacteria bacterium]|nr:hypothetical protein [Gammaproteobacteria bacterium]
MKNLLKTTALVTGMIATSGLMAATDGVVGGTSVGTLDIDVTVGDSVRISGLNDLIATFDGTNDIVHNDTACIYRNGTGLYQITAVGDGGVSGTDFSIDDGINPAIAYSVNWNDEAIPGAGVPVTSGTPVVGQTGADTSSTTCGNTGLNSAVQLTILASDLVGAPSGLLEGTLSITVSPE